MLDFINSNGVLFSGIFAVIAALITSLATIVKEKRSIKADTISSLRKELVETKSELEKYKIIEASENNIDKSEGSIYIETLPNGKTRDICGYCWERERMRIPVVRNIEYDEYTKTYYYGAYCNVCKTNCIVNIEPEIDEDVPF